MATFRHFRSPIPTGQADGAQERELQGGKDPALAVLDGLVVKLVGPGVQDVDRRVPLRRILVRARELRRPAALQHT